MIELLVYRRANTILRGIKLCFWFEVNYGTLDMTYKLDAKRTIFYDQIYFDVRVENRRYYKH